MMEKKVKSGVQIEKKVLEGEVEEEINEMMKDEGIEKQGKQKI